jgi:hypothetical protein
VTTKKPDWAAEIDRAVDREKIRLARLLAAQKGELEVRHHWCRPYRVRAYEVRGHWRARLTRPPRAPRT